MLPSMHTLGQKPVNSVLETDPEKPTLSRKEKRSQKQRSKKASKRTPSVTKESDHPAQVSLESEDPVDEAEAATIVATAQQTRFYKGTYDEFGKNIMLDQFTLSVKPPGRKDKSVELLRDTQLKLNYGYKYGLVGANGIGKSTLLQALADGLVEGLPTSLRVLYLNQLDTSLLTARDARDRSVLQTVLDADTRVQIVKDKLELLEKALGTSSIEDFSFTSSTIRMLHFLLQVQVLEAEEDFEKANKIAIKRSGMRGKDARLRLIEAEDRLKALRKRLKDTESLQEEPEDIEESSLLKQIHEKTEGYQQELKLLDEVSMEARARRILSSMSISPEKQEAPLSSLSGGWQVRILLARVLFMEPDFLLLDEPTNHLDMPSILWLKDYLLSLEDVLGYQVTLVLVSHDRFFLNATTEETILFRGYDKTLAYYDGSYDAYEKAMEHKKLFNERLQTKLEQKTDKMTKMVSGLNAQAKATKDDKKAQVAASKKKKMERIGLERNASGHRMKLNRDRAGYYFGIRDGAEDTAKYESVVDYPAWKILSSSPPQIRNLSKLEGTTMLSLGNVSFQYEAQDTQTSTLPLKMDKLNLTIEYGDKIVVLGRNGAGKTTLMKLLDGAVTPTSGKIERFNGARVVSLMQHNVENLKRLDWSRRLTPLALLKKLEDERDSASEEALGEVPQASNKNAKDGKLRAHLSSFGIMGDTAVGVPLESLSGGQLVRVGLAWATFPHPPHVLLLDEPTNHLDMGTIDVLARALRDFEGAVVLISHDLHFLDVFTSQDESEREARVLEITKKKGVVNMKRLEGGIDEYKDKQEGLQASIGQA